MFVCVKAVFFQVYFLATYKAMEEQNTHAEGPPAVGPMTTGSTLPELSGLTKMVRAMIEDREQREREIAFERERRDREIAERRDRERDEERERMERRADERHRYAEASEQRIRHRQMEQLQQLVTKQSAARTRHDPEPAKLTRLTEHDDIEAYLTTFERPMKWKGRAVSVQGSQGVHHDKENP